MLPLQESLMYRAIAFCALTLCLLAVPPAVSAGTAELVADLTPPGPGPYPTLNEIINLVSVGQKAIFIASEPSSGKEVWATDGTSAGTQPLRDLCLGYCSSEPVPLGAIGREAFFLTYDLATRGQIWRTDGTTQGTTLVPLRVLRPFRGAQGRHPVLRV
jgi:ELWxxDGT repeat protein